ncbi:MAG: RNA-binding transcriptional accessory protein [Crocinitomicaceae bacterium]|nr:RNA-binding transcriptional accessory protein [Crocinitomicaceae bacterium]
MEKVQFITQLTSIGVKSVENTLKLIESGATVPFISRYRKEQTGNLDEVQITAIRDEAKKYDDIIARQQTIIKSIEQQDKLSQELADKINSTFDLVELEDIYLPFKQRKETRGDKAKKAGLEPLAKMIMSQRGDLYAMAARFVKGTIDSEEEAIQGAKDIIAEWINESVSVRAKLRNLFTRKGKLSSKLVKGKETEAEKYKDYFDFAEPLYKTASHRFLALYRADREGLLKLTVQPEKDEAIDILHRQFVRGNDDCSTAIEEACNDAYKRLLLPSLQNETIQTQKEKADKDAIKVFSTNLRQLLLAPPLGEKRVLAIDPGFRTGCKVVCIDEHGSLLTNTTIYPHPPQNESAPAKAKIAQLVEAYKIEAIAIGDGTAGRETESFIKHIRFNRDLQVFSVREDGASIYSASPIARKEFPEYDVTVRGAVSIGRRLMDPLAELVKIDPKSVGVGQYQHEVNQTQLKEALDDVVISAVNTVGVDLNTASPYLLSYVSGLGPQLAENIVAYRSEVGKFTSREELKKVKRLGDKAFEQAAGFLRIREGINPLDNSSVHPESYKHVEKIAKKLGLKTVDLIGNTEQLSKIKSTDFQEIDSYTFTDIINELKKPGRDPRKQVKVLEFDSSIRTIEDLKIGMELEGIVTNVTAFGAFVNIGIKENGLIHKSQLSDEYVEDPSQYIRLHEHVHVRVLEIDVPRKRVGLKKLK